jgi:hypothetical protein
LPFGHRTPLTRTIALSFSAKYGWDLYVHDSSCRQTKEGKELKMVRIKVRYNKYDRTFKLVDQEFGSILEDDSEYHLLVPVMCEDVEEEESFVLVGVPIAHA